MSLSEMPKTTVTKTVKWPDTDLKPMSVADVIDYLGKLDPAMPVELRIEHRGELFFEPLTEAELKVQSATLVIGG